MLIDIDFKNRINNIRSYNYKKNVLASLYLTLVTRILLSKLPKALQLTHPPTQQDETGWVHGTGTIPVPVTQPIREDTTQLLSFINSGSLPPTLQLATLIVSISK